MKKRQLLLIILCLVTVRNVSAQRVSFPDDEKERGYTNRPYLRYEAEPGKCTATGSFLEATYDQRQIQSEASNQIAVQLVAKEAYVQWTNEKEADGLTIRFSLPDNAEGTGTKGTLALYVDGVHKQAIELDSYWAWQYFLKTMSNPYPDNVPNASEKFPRMRFDEIHVKLPDKIPAGSVFQLVKTDDNDSPYTIDFVELEAVPAPVTFESIPDENKVQYDSSVGLAQFINSHGGKTIYLPEGKYNVNQRIVINHEGAKLIGAGMWHTEIYFTASSDERGTYSNRGVEVNRGNIVLEGLFLNTINNKRYYNNDDKYQVGKGLMGNFGANSIIRNVWAEHFECGAWIDGTDRLTLSDCRFRNNYADGINLSYGSKNSIVEQCSFRNNGDDDMATWSRGEIACENNIFRYCTAENNWRASSLGFFGGKENKAYNCVILDPMEAGFRITCDFPGAEFSSDGYSEFHDISVYRGGVNSGSAGGGGDLWGNRQGAIHINSASQYTLQNIKIYNIDLYDSKSDAIFIGSASKSISNLILKDIYIDKTGRYGIYYNNAKGDAQYCNIEYKNIGAATNTNSLPSAFRFIENCKTALETPETRNLQAVVSNGNLVISGFETEPVSVYDLLGRKQHSYPVSTDKIIIPDLPSGIYLVHHGRKTLKITTP
ncbi:MAG: right-handed parallel beta-helix repeat-containing protein [Dysgonamonadaceae bacterium]|jgi:parallel beta-helix repeat protein|nr:right-handed parallel beta-helix repeat-containing protein [Dysgonamonadaceae bacterium]